MGELTAPDNSLAAAPSDVAAQGACRDVQVFLCYRRADGNFHAEWLNELLNGAQYTEPSGATCRLRLYYDKTAPGVANWKLIHFPSLQTSQALVLICTPGIAKDLSRRGHPDWVYEELRWWVRNRQSAPIVVDTTGEGDRWLPELVARRWPDINRIDVRREDAEAAARDNDRKFGERIRQRIVTSIVQSEHAAVFEDLERSRRLSQRLRLWLASALVLLAVAIGMAAVAWRFNQQASANFHELLVEQGRSDLLFGDPTRAAVYLSEAYGRGHPTDATRSLLADAMRWIDLRQAPLDGKAPLTQGEYAPDGSWFVTAGGDGIARIWDARTGRELRRLHHGAYISSIAVDPSGKRIATIGYDVALKMWDAQSGSELPRFEGASPGQSLQFSPAGDRVLAASREGVRVWDARSGQLVAQAGAHRWRQAALLAMFDPSGLVIASTGNEGTVTLWDARTGDPLHLLKHESKVNAIRFTAAGEELVAGQGDGRITIWNVKEGKARTTLGTSDESPLAGIHSLAIDPASPQVVAGTMNGVLKGWSLRDGASLWRVAPHRMNIMNIAYDARGTRFATAGSDGSAKVWDARTGALLANLDGHSDTLRAVRFSPDGESLLTVADDHEARQWNLRAIKLRRTLGIAGYPGLSGGFIEGGRAVVGQDPEGRITVWQSDTGKIVRRFGAGVGAVEASPRGDRLLSAEGEFGAMQVRLWNVETGERLAGFGPARYVSASFFDGGRRAVLIRSGEEPTDRELRAIDSESGETIWSVRADAQQLHVSQDGSHLAVGPFDATGVALYDARTGKLSKRVAAGRFSPRVWLSPDGKYLFTISTSIHGEGPEPVFVVGNPVEVWDVQTGRLLGSLTGHTGSVIQVGFSPDGRWVVTVGLDRTGRIWAMDSRTLVAKLEGHTGAIRDLAFSRDSRRIATASEDGTARVWEPATGRLLTTLAGYGGLNTELQTVSFDESGERLLAYGPALTVWDVGLERRDASLIQELVARSVPWRLVGGRLEPRNGSPGPAR